MKSTTTSKHLAEGVAIAQANGTAGRLTDFAVVPSGDRPPVLVQNSAVVTDSSIFIQVEKGATAVQTAAITVSVDSIAAGAFILDVRNNDGAGATLVPPIYHYLVVNPAGTP